MSSPKKIAVTLEVTNDAEAQELTDAWQEIVTGKRLVRAEALEHHVEAVMERARVALQIIETAIRQNPTTGQAGRLVRFLAALYNGYDYSFDLTALRALDTELANACLDYDRLGKVEVHTHLADGDRELQRWIRDYRVEPRLTLDEKRAEGFAQLTEQTEHTPNELLREAVDLLLDKHGRKASSPKR
jgi:NADH dehydrogenase/NADH:ubiquinone oxidoreductase subunit G